MAIRGANDEVKFERQFILFIYLRYHLTGFLGSY